MKLFVLLVVTTAEIVIFEIYDFFFRYVANFESSSASLNYFIDFQFTSHDKWRTFDHHSADMPVTSHSMCLSAYFHLFRLGAYRAPQIKNRFQLASGSLPSKVFSFTRPFAIA
jgi:hypothetical protein